MALKQRSNVPKFGTWENADNDVPYTVYFDKARKNRGAGGMMINPNDPQENPEMFGNVYPIPPARTKPDEPVGRGAAVRQHRVSREENEFSTDSRGRNEKTTNEGGQRPAAARSAQSSFERSPLHPHYQAKVMGRGNGSPAWEGRNGDTSHGRSRLRPVRADESPEKGAAVPRFGEWNESDPQSAENFTAIFSKVREERNTAGTGNVMGTPKHQSYIRNQPSNKPKKCCFPWW